MPQTSTLSDPTSTLHRGDRWEIFPSLGGWDLLRQIAIGLLQYNTPLEIESGEKQARLQSLTDLTDFLDTLRASSNNIPLYLECVSSQPLKLRLLSESDQEFQDGGDLGQPSEFQTDQGISVLPSAEDQALIASMLSDTSHTLEDFQLSLSAGRFTMVVGFDQLFSLPQLRDVEPLEHQLKTVHTVLRRFRGRALLCDEVGLGKTIEAGICLLELIMRGLVQRVLILTPPSLVAQWEGEMRRKFSLDFITHDDPSFREMGNDAWVEHDRILASYHTAKREPHRSAVLSQPWDMVIIDEAHHFRNRQTLLWRFASEIRKKYILLLTATPVQNHLDELFNLVTLLEPGLLSTSRRFQQTFVDRKDRMLPRNVEQLHERLSEVMVRNRRSGIGLQLTRRFAQTLQVTPSPEESSIYQKANAFIREHLRDTDGSKRLSRMVWITLQKELGSCIQAVVPTLERVLERRSLDAPHQKALKSLTDEARQVQHSTKADQLLKLLEEFPDQMVVFTQYRETLEMLRQTLEGAAISHSVFHGSLSRLQKEEAIQRFRDGHRVLLSTESGSEGRNLQFCHAVCNFDLPWNPMRIEQRIGRLSRIGQAHDVHIFNLVAEHTIEEAILALLEAKIHMFELVIGEIDMILTNFEEEQEFEDIVADLWSESADDEDFYRRMDTLGDKLLAAKQAYLEQRAYDDRLFGDRLAAE